MKVYREFINNLNISTSFLEALKVDNHHSQDIFGWQGLASLTCTSETGELYDIDVRYGYSEDVFRQHLIDYDLKTSISSEFDLKKNADKRHKIIIYLCKESLDFIKYNIDTIQEHYIIGKYWQSVQHLYLPLSIPHPFNIPVAKIENFDDTKINQKNLSYTPSQDCISSSKAEGGLRAKGITKKNLDNHPLISIVTVVLNGERYIEQTIQSVINQSYENLEYILVDGCSSDGTLEIIKKYENFIDYWISCRDEGLSDAMNRAASLCEGSYLAYLHSDDLFISSNFVEEVVETIIKNPSRWITGPVTVADYNGAILYIDPNREYSFKEMQIRNIIRHQATFVETSKSREIGFSHKYKFAMDHFYFLNYWKKYSSPVFLKGTNVVYRNHPNSLSSNYLKSTSSELIANIDFRIQEKEFFGIIFHLIIYCLRVIKIIIYHYPRLFFLRLIKYSDK